jgi:hypothetical protein
MIVSDFRPPWWSNWPVLVILAVIFLALLCGCNT